MSNAVGNFYEFIWAKLTATAGKKNNNGLRKRPIAFVHLILYIKFKGKT